MICQNLVEELEEAYTLITVVDYVPRSLAIRMR